MHVSKLTVWLVTFTPAIFAQMDFTAATSAAAGAVWVRSDHYGHPSSAPGKSLFWNSTVLGFSPDSKTDLIAGTSSYVAAPGKDSYAALAGAKRVLLQRDRLTASVGGILLSPFAGAQRDTFGFAFALADYRLRQLNGTTVTAGVHRTLGRDPSAGWTRNGTILGFSTPLRNSDRSWQLSFDVSWISGHHFFGYHVYDLSFRRNRLAIVTGYGAANRPTANHGPFVSVQYRLR